MGKYRRVKEGGITFLFKYDEVDQTLLHIFARHLMEVDDALDLFFDTDASWNEQFERYENYSETHGLFWFWRDEKAKVVMIITCFRIE